MIIIFFPRFFIFLDSLFNKQKQFEEGQDVVSEQSEKIANLEQQVKQLEGDLTTCNRQLEE